MTHVDDGLAPPPISRRLSPEDVLAIFVEMHRQGVGLETCDPEATIGFSTTVAEWREACDLLPVGELGTGYNSYFEIDLTRAEWGGVLEPEREKTLREVCDLVATRALKPKFEEMFLLGRPCPAASLFLTIRRELESAGWDTRELCPSSSLEPFLQGSNTLLSILIRLAPGRIPRAVLQHGRTSTVVGRMFAYATLAGLVGAVLVTVGFGIASLSRIEFAGAWYFTALAAAAVLVMLSITGMVAVEYVQPPRVVLGDLRTFRELCRAIVAKKPASHSSPAGPVPEEE